MIKKKRFISIRYIMIILSILISTLLYFYIYSVDDHNIGIKIAKSTDQENVEIIETYNFTDEKNAVMIHFESPQNIGIALLQKGLNGKFQISEIHQTNEELKSIEYLINGVDYSIIFGQRDYVISEILLNGVRNQNDRIESHNIFLLRSTKGFNGKVEVVNMSNEIEHFYLETEKGNSWKNVLIPLYCISIVLFTYLLTYKSRRYSLQDINEIPKDGQRIKQMRPW